LAYEANGNLKQRGAQTYTFDIGNRLKTATGQSSYAYDGLGRRSWVTYANGRGRIQIYSQAGQRLFNDRTDQGSTNHAYLDDRLVAEVNSSTGPRYMHADALGSPIACTSSTGGVVNRTSYEPYGGTVAGTTNPDGIGFTGHVNDPDTGLVYMQQRYYDPIAGRFLSVDAITASEVDGSSFNRYLYGNGNPFKFKDPDGRHPMNAADHPVKVLWEGGFGPAKEGASQAEVGKAVSRTGIAITAAGAFTLQPHVLIGSSG
jgi:RHS repeat-associated protein